MFLKGKGSREQLYNCTILLKWKKKINESRLIKIYKLTIFFIYLLFPFFFFLNRIRYFIPAALVDCLQSGPVLIWMGTKHFVVRSGVRFVVPLNWPVKAEASDAL